MSEFLPSLHSRLLTEKKVSDSTATQYIRTLMILHSKMPNAKKSLSNLGFLRKTDEVSGIITKDYAPSTQKTLYSILTSILDLYKQTPPYKKAYKFYYEKMMSEAKAQSEQDTAEKSEKQATHWASWDDILKVAKQLREKVLLTKSFKGEGWTHLLHSTLLTLYTSLPPRRNQDYLQMKIVQLKKSESIASLPADSNYLIVRPKLVPTEFVFNRYKTAKTYGQQIVPITDTALLEAISLYLKHYPSLQKQSPFLIDADGKPLTAANSITRILHKLFGKNIGSSMLRHIYLSEKYNIADMKEDATAMAHSVSQQRGYLKEESASAPPVDSMPQSRRGRKPRPTGQSANTYPQSPSDMPHEPRP